MTDEPPLLSGVAKPRRDAGPGPTLTRHIGRVSAIFDGAPIGVGVWSLDCRLLHANPVLCDLLQRPREQLVGEPIDRVLDETQAAWVQQLIAELAHGERNSVECEFRCRRPEGGEVWMTAHLTGVYGGAGRPEYLISQIFDFTDSRVAHSTGERLADESPVMLWLTDEHGIPRVANRHTYDFLGQPEHSDALRRGLFENLHPGDFDEVSTELRDGIRRRDPIEFTGRSRRHDNEWRWLHHRAMPVYDAHGEFGGYAGASFDITESESARRDLDDVSRLFRRLIEDGPLALARCDVHGRITYANSRWASIFDDAQTRLQGRNWQRLLLPEHVEELRQRGLASAKTREPFTIRVRALHTAALTLDAVQLQPGTQYWAELTVAPTFDNDELDGWVATLTDVSAEIAAGSRADQLARVLDAGSDYLMITERNLAISYVNNAAKEVLGVTAPAEEGEPPTFLMDVLDAESFEYFHEFIEPALVAEGIWRGELSFRGIDGQLVPASVVFLAHANDTGRIESISAVARDISDLKAAQAKLQELATHDYLTGLPNRVLLYDRLEQAVARFQRYGQPVALLYLDLDQFKPVNDELGHHVGDAVLVKIADRIHSVVRDTDTAARLGGDEFAVLVEGISDMELLRGVATRLIRGISEPITVGEAEATVGVSVGLVVADESCSEPDALMALADAAVYRAKAAGRGRFVELSPDGHEVTA